MRLADLVTGLSRLADLGFGLPPGESLRSSALAALLSRSLDLAEDDVRAALYVGLLRHVGCVGYAHETARMFGDEFVLNVAAERSNLADPRDVAATLVPAVTRGRPPVDRVLLTLTSLHGAGASESRTTPRHARSGVTQRDAFDCPTRCNTASTTPPSGGTAEVLRTAWRAETSHWPHGSQR